MTIRRHALSTFAFGLIVMVTSGDVQAVPRACRRLPEDQLRQYYARAQSALDAWRVATERSAVLNAEVMTPAIARYNRIAAPNAELDDPAPRLVRVRQGLRVFLEALGTNAAPGARLLVNDVLRESWPLVRHYECIELARRDTHTGCTVRARKIPPQYSGVPTKIMASLGRAQLGRYEVEVDAPEIKQPWEIEETREALGDSKAERVAAGLDCR